MNITRLLAICISIVTVTSTAYAQSDLVNFSGLGRVYITNDKLAGDGVENDTISKKRATNGYTLFDLGINVSPNETVKGSIILRAKNNFGGFYGDGSSLNIRQFRIEGVLGKIVKYQIGDIDLGLTPYTLYNFQEIFNDYEADVFRIRRDIVHYENFNFGNKWRLQGADVRTTLKFAKGIDKLRLNAFGTRIRRANFATLEPDRLLYGGRIQVVQSEYFEIGGNLTGISDVAGTVRDTLYQYDNLVTTADVKAGFDIGKVELGVFGEFGGSSYSFKSNKRRLDTIPSYNDFFYDGGLRIAVKPGNFRIGIEGSYREVGALFTSPGAQTRRTYDYAYPNLFDLYNNNSSVRVQTIFDRLTNEQLYNQTIRPVLMPFNPLYNNVTPYGIATPNRKGFTGKFTLRDSEKIIDLGFTAEMLSEILGEGTRELREFSSLRGGVVFGLGKLLKFKKNISLTGGIRQETTTRGGSLGVDLTSTLIDAGVTVEVLKSFDLLAGYKSFTAEGNEFTSIRNFSSGTIQEVYNLTYNTTENIIAAGIRYRFSNRSFFTGNYNILTYENNLETKNVVNPNYRLEQLFLNYTLVF